MNQLLRQFYAIDASYRKLPHSDQQRLFSEWAGREGIEGQLSFESPKWISMTRLGAIVLGLIYLGSFIPGTPALARAAFPFAMLLLLVTFSFEGRCPTIKQTASDSRAH